MKDRKSVLVKMAGILITSLLASPMLGCVDESVNPSEGTTIDMEEVGDTNRNDANVNEIADGESEPEWESSLPELNPSIYKESDFDTSGKIIFKTEHAVIDKEMESISYTIENLTGEELEYGEEYALEIKSGEQWYQVPFPENTAWNAVAYVLPEGNMSGGMINLAWMDFSYVDGDYRIVKKLGDYLVKAEFSMGEPEITPQTPFGYEPLEELPLAYTLDEAVEDGVVVFGYEKTFNLERLKDFMVKAKLGLPAMVRIGFSTAEGDPIFYDLTRNVTGDGREWYTFYHDSRRDKFMYEENRIITKENFSYLVTDGTDIYFSNCAEYTDTELFHESSRSLSANAYLYQPDLIEEILERRPDANSEELYEEAELYRETVAIAEEMTKNRLEWNWARYKSFSPEGTYYVSLNEEQLKRENVTAAFGFGTIGYGTSDYAIPVEDEELTGQMAITGILKVNWLDDETAQLVCATEKEGLHCYVEFYPKEAVDGNQGEAFGEREYVDTSNLSPSEQPLCSYPKL